MTHPDAHKKEPLPDQEQTVSSYPRIPEKEYIASEKERREILQSLRNRLRDRHARISGHYCTGEWRKVIGKAWPLLIVILCICDWKTGRIRTYVWALAEVIGVSEKSIYNWFKHLKQIDGFEVRRLRYGIAIYLPPRLIPNPERYKRSDQHKSNSYAQD